MQYGLKYTIDDRDIPCTKNDNNDNWLPDYHFGHAHILEVDEEINAEWIATNVYGKLLAPIINSMSTVKGLSREVLLVNYYTYLVS